MHQWSKAAVEMISICSKGIQNESNIKIIKQAGRELLLSQSSDWSFILKAGTTTELARERINLHLKRICIKQVFALKINLHLGIDI